MRYETRGPILAGLAALLLVACGGGGDDDGPVTPANVPPRADAGAAQTVTSGAVVTLNGSASSDPDGNIATYAWTQSAGAPAVTLSNPASAQPTFTAPDVANAATLTFSLTVTDNRGATSTASTVTITVNPANNTSPTANAGSPQTVTSGDTVTLDGTGSSDPDGTIATYAWSQTGGTPVVPLSDPASAEPTFLAPTVTSPATLTFSLVVTDNRGAISPASTITVIVNPPGGGNVTVTGTIRYQRVNFNTVNLNAGLNYANQTMHPARVIVVRAIDGTTDNVLATGTTNENGVYALSVPANSSIRIQAVAQMLRDDSSPLPRWDFSVMDIKDDDDVPKPNPEPYVFTDAAPFNSNTAGAHDLAILSGFNSSGTVTGTRASAPFAILDTVYQAVQTVLSVAPNTEFPVLVLDWAPDNPGGETYFDPGPNVITLAAEVTEDTDEFDQHVIAHEFGHYVEDSFSRADNIGGPHGRGDKLDIRVAFGEGFGYAFAAIVLNDPVARDSYVSGTNRVSSTFDVEDNPPSNPVGSDDYGCFCSESSVWSILWDLYDPVPDGEDTLSLGFEPLWNVLVNEQRTTPAMTSIFSFIAALKANRPGDAAAINQLLLAQNVDVVVDAFATGQGLFPPSVPESAVLPLYEMMSIGQQRILFSTDAAGTFNALGNRRFIRFNVSDAPRNITITAYSSNTTAPVDTDFVVYRNGEVITTGFSPNGSATTPEVRNFMATQNGTYIIDVYDCANGCGDQGTPGDYNLTVTIN